VVPLEERFEVMDKSAQDEKVEMLALYAVSMHLGANEKIGKAARFVTIAAVLIAIYMSSFWPLVIAVVLCVAIYFYVIQSCVRFVERETGMPQDVQIHFSHRYKIDPQFAKEVDQLHARGSEIARHL
jgi:hypothetical protein